MTEIRGVIFDMDGVLIDAKDWHYEALNRALGMFGYSISRYDHLVTYDGLPTRRKLEMLSMERGLPRSLHGFLNELKQIYTMELVHQRCKPVFQHEYALSSLKAAGYKLALASNSVRATVDIMMEKAKLAPYFDAVLSNEDVGNAKPDPEIYRRTIEHLRLSPEQCLVVEDNDHGVRAAQAAGAHVMVVGGITAVTLDAVRARIGQCEALTTSRRSEVRA